ncbi:lysine N(6)-hydroxylase/L-ornithine N(5)-oxygenase family protein [Gallaecimonas mangrovi]|uniref:lysine N(6)-hydroxylase/L-ornithine N(5)-oxygenase family protein n=1 Tax=Gallaecimonas mangrovi TaxID=2291597 RepID=UPI000E202BAE|nr:lysine N(6)-hydroxylase/L-ornithine N(5)-oxygenase family protein [Gallaecimonas mangrovi]
MAKPIIDVLGVGLGPFNLSLACLAEPVSELKALFVDQRPGFDWHPGLMMEDVHLQTPFMSDLVTLADPTSRYSFLNYIKQQGRLYSFYIRENFFLLRREYNQYCQWVSQQLSNIRFNRRVDAVHFDEQLDCYRVNLVCSKTGQQSEVLARKLVLGTGPKPFVPKCCENLDGPVLHASQYLYQKAQLQQQKAITVLGSGQSAAEIFYDLLQDIDSHGYQLNWLTRSPRFFPLEYSKLTLEMTSPEYVDYFHALPGARRDALISSQKHLYKGINSELINAIFDCLYAKRLSGRVPVELRTNVALEDANYAPEQGFSLRFYHQEQGRHFQHQTQGLVLATGYRYQVPAFLTPVAQELNWDNQGRFAVRRDYSIDKSGGRVFVQNAELHSHGFVTPDLGMACYRNSCILRSLTGREVYPVEKRIAFQEFGAGQSAVTRQPLETLL